MRLSPGRVHGRILKLSFNLRASVEDLRCAAEVGRVFASDSGEMPNCWRVAHGIGFAFVWKSSGKADVCKTFPMPITSCRRRGLASGFEFFEEMGNVYGAYGAKGIWGNFPLTVRLRPLLTPPRCAERCARDSLRFRSTLAGI